MKVLSPRTQRILLYYCLVETLDKPVPKLVQSYSSALPRSHITNDDHTQYVPVDGVARQLADAGYPNALLLDGSRAMTGDLDLPQGAGQAVLFKDLSIRQDPFDADNLVFGNRAKTLLKKISFLGFTVYNGVCYFQGNSGLATKTSGKLHFSDTGTSREVMKIPYNGGCVEFAYGKLTGSFDLNNQELQNGGVIKVPNIPVADPADGTNTLWMDVGAGRVLKVGT